MKKISIALAAIAIMTFAGCGSTTDKEPESQNYKAPDSAVGNSDAANKIYRDTTNIQSATEAGGGTANPAPSDSTSEARGQK